jgi:serine/threonine protein kinase
MSPPPSSEGPVDHAARVLADRYRLERRIGQGGMAEVWVAVDEQLDRRVAVKWLKPNLASDEVVAERFRREAVAVARLNHPNIVTVHDVFEHDGRQAVVMQLIEGQSLRQVLDNRKRLGPELTIHIGASVAGALDEAHRAGFVHRDVKPGNILFTQDGRVLLTDFGIAKALDTIDEDLTSDNVMMGTAKYLAPEQVRGHKLDGRADLYSLGLVLYECLAGRVPFLGNNDAETALARLQRDPTDLAHLRPTLPLGLVNLIHKTLARNPAHRPPTGADLRKELIAVDTTPPHIDGTPIEPPPVRVEPHRDANGSPVSPVTPPTGVSERITDRVATVPERQPEPGASAIAGQPEVDATRNEHNDPSTAVRRDRPHDDSSTIFGVPLPANSGRTLVIGGLILAVIATLAVVLLRERPQAADISPLPEVTAAPIQVDSGEPVDLDSAAELDQIDRPVSALGDPGIQAWDPFGDNNSENDALAPLALADGSRSTAWATECYSDKYMGAKLGVGLVLSLPSTSTGRLAFESLNAPFQIDVLSSMAAEAPTDFGAWAMVGDTSYDTEPGRLIVDVTVPASHLLIWLRELGPDDACSRVNPFRGRIGEITWSAAG